MTQESMDSVSLGNTEIQRLHAISTKVDVIQEYLESRLHRQKVNILALLCGAKWRITCMKEIKDSKRLLKKLQTEMGSFDYRVKEQGESLTRLLCDLDNILSNGNEEIRNARKDLVIRIQKLLNSADNWKNMSAKVLDFGEKLLSVISNQLKEDEGSVNSNDMDSEILQDTDTTETSTPTSVDTQTRKKKRWSKRKHRH
jgi:hypothetical protein